MATLFDNAVTPGDEPDSRISMKLEVNGRECEVSIDPRMTLLDCLREVLHLTGTKKGCDQGQCGACTIHINGRRMNSCLALAAAHAGDEIVTIEGLGRLPDSFIPCRRRFSRTTPINAAIAHPDKSCRRWRCSTNRVAFRMTTFVNL